LCPTTKPTSLARDIAQIHGCEIGSREEAMSFAAALREGRTIRLEANPGVWRGVDDLENERWRNQYWGNARGEGLWRKVRAAELKLRDPSDAADATSDQKDAHWLSLMVTAWLLLFGYYHTADYPLVAAGVLAAQAGEAEYFDRFMRPYFLNFGTRVFAI